MAEIPKSSLTIRLEGLINRYPECPWLQEFWIMSLKKRVKQPVQITIDNEYVDQTYRLYLSDN